MGIVYYKITGIQDVIIFGVPCVGKTTTGILLAQKLAYDFYDIDEEVITQFNTTIEKFINAFGRYERDRIRGGIIGQLLARNGDKVISVTPMSYSRCFNKYIQRPDVIAIELQDEPENILNRLIFTDENDQIYEDSEEYREAHRDYYLNDIREDIKFYSNSFKKIELKFQMNNAPPDLVVERLIEQYFQK
ncbi:MAG: shikimate kinase [Bacillota bacterium]|nr:shikimate kinase [Bacillota bacterium]